MYSPPTVTGISPKEGPPGTKITIRGENFGKSQNDVISIVICGSDCTLSAEWKSSKKIIARSGLGKGSGDIIITTKQGGEGTCTVKFRGYHETVGPLKESAVWVEDPVIPYTSRRSLSPTSYQTEDPLCLFVEATDQTIPEDDLNELFPNASGNLGSQNFSPGYFLLQYHFTTHYDDLKAGLSHLRRKVLSQKESQLSFLKANVGCVLDQLDTLAELKDKLEEGVQDVSKSARILDEKISDTEKQVIGLFQEVLARREQAEGKRNALTVLQRFRFLFCLPSVIDRNIKNGEFDLIVNDYAKVKRLFGNTEVELFKKVLTEIDNKIETAKEAMLKTLEELPVTFDESCRMIRNLTSLGCKEDPAWLALQYFADYLVQMMHELKDKFLVLETSESTKKHKLAIKTAEGKPHRVMFLEDLVDIMEIKFSDLWKLGQTYFSGEFSSTIPPGNPAKFKDIVLNVVLTFSNLTRAALLPHSLQKSPNRNYYGTWSSSNFDAIMPWLPHCLRYIRTCYGCFIRLDLPSDVLDLFSEVIFGLRLNIGLSLWKQASDEVVKLQEKEDWVVNIHDEFGGKTELPSIFYEITFKAIKSVHETVLESEIRERDLADDDNARFKIIAAIQGHFQKLIDVFEAFCEDEERASVISQLNATAESSFNKNGQQHLLITMCNVNFTYHAIIPKIFEDLSAHKFPIMSELAASTQQSFEALSNKIVDQYFDCKCDPLVCTIEPSMYFGHFDWDCSQKPVDIRPYAKEIILNLIGVRAELYRVPTKVVRGIMSKFVETVAEELARLMSCVKAFSKTGRIQAVADVIAVREATKKFSSSKANAFFKEALENVPTLNQEESICAKTLCDNFVANMALQLMSLTAF